MATPGKRGTVRDIRALARRVYERLVQYPRLHDGRTVPIDDTLSRILEHEPAYHPLRPRSPTKSRKPQQELRLFNVQRKVADALDTTMGDLLGEPGYTSPLELLTIAERKTLRDAFLILRKMFDLDDPSLDQSPREQTPAETFRFVVPAAEFIERDHDYPRTLHAWVVPDVPANAGSSGAEMEEWLTTTKVLHSIREVWDARLQVIRVIGDSMAPEFRDGWKLLVDTEQRHPAEGALVAVYIKDEGGVIGRWNQRGHEIRLLKSNPTFPAIHLGHPDEWTLWGTVTRIVEAPVPS